jgi:type IV pilus assembly protein PilM
LFTRDVSVGGNQYTDTLQKELDLSYADAEKLKQGLEVGNITREQRIPHLCSVSEILMLEVQKTFDFFRQTPAAENVQQIYLAGGSAKIEGLVKQLKEEFRVPVEIIDPFRKVKVDPEKFDSAYLQDIAPCLCVAMGLALRSFD